ncbi:hypothetical protein [Nocardia carnea]|uniref:hypothetical protein n=1 Tax=Nocardia carnea TaxID=37328 RepID=UPI00031F85CF|nr:hypothetical protein [Nocardia carnea]
MDNKGYSTAVDCAVELDDPVNESLRGRHAHLSRWAGRAGMYLPEVASFAAVGNDPDEQTWEDLARLGRSGRGRGYVQLPGAAAWRTGSRFSLSTAGR